MSGAERLGFALTCCVGALAMFGGVLIGLGDPLPAITQPRNQTPIAWATTAPTPTMRPFASHGDPAPYVRVQDRCMTDALRGPWYPTAVATSYGPGR